MKKNDIRPEELSYRFGPCALKIYDSYKVSTQQMHKILNSLKQENENALAKRTVSNMVDEWATHNLCYMLHIKRANTKDVDLNYSLEWYWKCAYFIVGNIAKLIIKLLLKIKMNRHCRKFTTHNQYEEFIRNNDLLLPNLSICADNPDISHVHFNPILPDPYNGYEYIDLGLPSGLKWATCNVGASTPTKYGDYFMWGSTEPDTDNTCDWAHAPFNNGSTSYDSNYFKSVKDSVCPNGTLAPEYDAVHAIMGGNWRMPTVDEFKELIDNTTNAWVTNYQGSGIKGREFTSKTDGSKKLFIPAAGYRNGSNSSYKRK